MTFPVVDAIEGDIKPLPHRLPEIPSEAVEALPPEEQRKLAAVRDAQQTMLDLARELRDIKSDYAPVLIPTLSFHITMCGYRKTAAPYPMDALGRLDVENARKVIDSDLDYPVDARGTVVVFNVAPALRNAVAVHLSRLGYRLDPSKRQIKKRPMPGMLGDACTWVHRDAPDSAAEDLQPSDTAESRHRPPDVRALAAERDGVQPVTPKPWQVRPKVEFIDEERSEQ
ncbi:MAG: phage gene 29 protein family protein [Mycobacterium sp.]